MVMFGFYPLCIGYFLSDYLPKKISMNVTFFLFNWTYWVGFFCAILILFDGNEASFSGFLAIPFFYFFFSAIYVYLFSIKVLKSVLSHSEVSLIDSLGSALLLVFWPLGVWIIHPKIKKILESS